MYRHNSLLAKMAEQQIKDLSDAEIERVFADCVAPGVCKRGVKMMLADGLTVEAVYSFPHTRGGEPK